MVPADRLEAVREALRSDESLARLIRANALASGFHLSLVGCNMAYTALAATQLIIEGASALSGRRLEAVRLDPYEAAHPDPLTFEFLAEAVLRPLIEPVALEESGAEPIYFVDASKLRPGDEEAWKLLFQRMNELRNRIIRELGAPLVVLVPLDWTAVFARHSPDMWAVRSVQVKLAPVVAAVREPEVGALPSAREERPSFGVAGDVDALSRAVEEARDEARKRPDDIVALRALSISLDRLGEALKAAGDLAGAGRAFEEEMELDRRLVALDDGVERRRDLSVSLEKLGDVLRAQGDLSGAREHFEECLSLRQGLLGQDASHPEGRSSLSVSLEKLGRVLAAQGDFSGARQRYEESLTLMQGLVRQDETRLEWRRNLSVSLEKLGDVLVAQGDMSAAQQRYEESLTLRQGLVRLDESRLEWRLDLSVSLEKLGDVLRAQADLTAARQRYEESIALVRGLLGQNESHPEWLFDLSVSLRKLGNVLRAQGDMSGARQRYEESIAFLQRLLEQDDSRADWLCDIGVSFAKLADMARGSCDFAQAAGYFRQAKQYFDDAASLSPENARFRSLAKDAASRLAYSLNKY